MSTSKHSISAALLAVLFLSSGVGSAATTAQNILINEDLQVPGVVLKPGKYGLAVEDRLYDRVIIKMWSEKSKESYFFLAVPNAELKDERVGGLIFYRENGGTTPALRGWKGLELVYPKADAIKITGDSGEAVLASDPASDKLPSRMSRSDMKVVTLWSLAPKELTSDKRGMGVKAAKYASALDSSATVSAPALAAKKVERASTSAPAVKRLPKTASNNYSFVLWGTILLGLSASLRRLGLAGSAAGADREGVRL